MKCSLPVWPCPSVALEPRLLWLAAVCCKIQQCIFVCNNLYWFNFNTNYFHSTTILIQLSSTLDIFIKRLYSFNFNTGYFCARQIFIQLQRPKLCFIKRIDLFNFNKKNIFSFNKTYLFNSSSSRTSINSYSTKLHLPTPLPRLL